LEKEIGQRLRIIIQESCVRYGIVIETGTIRSDHIHILIKAPGYMSPSKISQVLKGKTSYILEREFPELKKRYWGQHLWARGYLCATVGAVTEETIKKYIGEQDNENDNFKIWDQDLFCNVCLKKSSEDVPGVALAKIFP